MARTAAEQADTVLSYPTPFLIPQFPLAKTFEVGDVFHPMRLSKVLRIDTKSSPSANHLQPSTFNLHTLHPFTLSPRHLLSAICYPPSAICHSPSPTWTKPSRRCRIAVRVAPGDYFRIWQAHIGRHLYIVSCLDKFRRAAGTYQQVIAPIHIQRLP